MIKKITAIVLILAAIGSATVVDGVGGLGLGGNAARTALWKSTKRIDAGVTVKNDNSKALDGEKSKDSIRQFPNAPWVTWTDGLGKGFYQVGLSLEAWKNYDTDINNTGLSFEYAQDLGGIIGGIGIGYDTLSAKDKSDPLTETTTSTPLSISLGLAKALDSKQTVLLGYKTGTNYTESTKTKGVPKAEETDVIQNTDVAVGYVYTVSNALQLGAQVVSSWVSSADATKTIGLAASYLATKDLEVQGYLNFANGVDGVHNEDKDWDYYGKDITNYGVNVLYSLAKLGTIGAGIDVTDATFKDEEYKTKNAVGTLFYTYLF